MAEVVVFHHALGLTPGVAEFAEGWRGHGHLVHTPDLFEGHTFDDLDEAVDFVDGQGMDHWIAAATAACAAHPHATVFAGFSLGAACAQFAAQSRPGARAALLFHGAMSLETMELPWTDGVRLQVHTAEADPWVELDQAQELIEAVDGSELFLYPGSAHLFTDASWKEYDEQSTRLVNERSLALLARL